jgi:hypothetical protein
MTKRSPLVTALVLVAVGTLGGMAGFGLGLLGQASAQAPKKDELDKLLEGAAPELAKEVAKERDGALLADPQKLAKEKVDAARKELEARFREFIAGRGTLDFLFQAAVRLHQAESATAENDDQRLAVHEHLWKLALVMEKTNKSRYDAGRLPISDYQQCVYFRIDAQQKWLAAVAAKKSRS